MRHLQRDRRFETAMDLIEVTNNGLEDLKTQGSMWTTRPLWLKVWVRNFDGKVAEVAVQLSWNSGILGQIGYGKATVHKNNLGSEFTVDIGVELTEFDPSTTHLVPWPETTSPAYWRLTIQGIGSYPPDPDDVETYRLEWWLNMLNDVPDQIRREIMTAPFTQTEALGYTAPDSTKILILTTDDTDRNLPILKANFAGVEVVISDVREIAPDRDWQGGFGRRGRQVRARITIFARGTGRTDTRSETALKYISALREDMILEFDPVGDVNTLGGYCYETILREVLSPTPVPALGEDVVACAFDLDCFKMQYLEGDEPPFVTGDGIEFNFNAPIMEADYLMNDHGYVYVSETGYWHKFGIRGLDLTTASKWIDHWRSKDLRTWEQLADLEVGTGTPGNWRNIIYAPSPIQNPNYGVAGAPYQAYRYLMTYTGVTETGVNSKEKIGLLATSSTDLLSWVQIGPAGVGDDNPIYWAGMPTTTYPLGSPWCPTSYYDGAWSGASRDSELWYDEENGDWYLLCTSPIAATGNQGLAFAKCDGGGANPDFGVWDHEATPLVACDDPGLNFESSSLVTYGGRHFLFFTGTGGTRVQSSTTNPATARPFSGDPGAGNLVNDSGPVTMLANNLAEIESGIFLIGGHKLDAGVRCWIAIQELDFNTLISDPVDGDYPTETSQIGIGGLVGWNEEEMDRSLRWTIQDSEGTDGAFYYQPVLGDQALAAGYAASGMSGNAYIATHFRHYQPSDGLDGSEWSDYTRVGWIKSSSFEITRNRIELYVAGGSDISESFVALVRADTDQVLFREAGTGDHTLTRRLWDTTDLRSEAGGRGLQVYLAIVDQGVDAGDCIDVDAIREYEKVGTDPVTPSTPEVNGPTLASLITIGS